MTEPAIDPRTTELRTSAVDARAAETRVEPRATEPRAAETRADTRATDPGAAVRVPSMTADAARASVSMHIIHLELARSMPDASITPVLHLALPASFAADLVVLLAQAVELRDQLRAAAMSKALSEDDDPNEDECPTTSASAPRAGATLAQQGAQP